MGFAFVASFEDSHVGGETFLGRLANRLALMLILTPVMVAIFSVIAGLALLAYKTYLYLLHGYWIDFYVRDIVITLDIPIELTGWIGGDILMLDVLGTSGLTALLLWIPLTIALLIALVALVLVWLLRLIR